MLVKHGLTTGVFILHGVHVQLQSYRTVHCRIYVHALVFCFALFIYMFEKIFLSMIMFMLLYIFVPHASILVYP